MEDVFQKLKVTTENGEKLAVNLDKIDALIVSETKGKILFSSGEYIECSATIVNAIMEVWSKR